MAVCVDGSEAAAEYAGRCSGEDGECVAYLVVFVEAWGEDSDLGCGVPPLYCVDVGDEACGVVAGEAAVAD